MSEEGYPIVCAYNRVIVRFALSCDINCALLGKLVDNCVELWPENCFTHFVDKMSEDGLSF